MMQTSSGESSGSAHTFDEEHHPTFFEITTALAFDYFRSQGVDLVVLETGLGGRLDATNVVHPLVSVLTSIDMDHQKWLGNTLGEIAAEKAGIIKPGVPVVSGPQFAEVRTVLEQIAAGAFCSSFLRGNSRRGPLHRIGRLPSAIERRHRREGDPRGGNPRGPAGVSRRGWQTCIGQADFNASTNESSSMVRITQPPRSAWLKRGENAADHKRRPSFSADCSTRTSKA